MSREFDLLKRVQELSLQQKEKQQYSFDGIITVTNNLLLQKSDKTKEYLDKVKFFVLDLGEVFYKVRKLKQFFCNHYSINYDVFRESLDVEEREIFGKFFGIKRRLQKNGIKLSKEDNLYVSETMILSIVDTSKKKYLVSIENSKLIGDFTKVIVELIQQQQKILLNKENKDGEIVLFTFEKDVDDIGISFKPVKLGGKFDDVVKDVFEDNYTKYITDFETFVKYSETYTSSNIREIKKDILNKIKSVINKYDDENQEIVDDIISSVNTNSNSIETKKVESKSQNVISVDDILNELNGSNKSDTVINLDDLLNDTDDEEIPF